MKVSIQIPTYNQPGLLSRAVESALAQTHEDIEVVVCDDSGTGRFPEGIAHLQSPRLKIFSNEKNLGRAANYRHLLYDLVSGDWVVNLDADDFFSDSFFISRAASLIAANSGVLLYMANIRSLEKVMRKCRSAKIIDKEHILVDGLEYLSHYTCYPGFRHLACLYNRQLAMESGFYSMDSLNNDFVSMMKLASQGKVILSSCQVGTWNLNEQSASHSLHSPREHENNLRSLDELFVFLAGRHGEKKALPIKQKLYILQEYYKNQVAILSKSLPGAVFYLLSQFAFNRFYVKSWLFLASRKLFPSFSSVAQIKSRLR